MNMNTNIKSKADFINAWNTFTKTLSKGNKTITMEVYTPDFDCGVEIENISQIEIDEEANTMYITTKNTAINITLDAPGEISLSEDTVFGGKGYRMRIDREGCNVIFCYVEV